MRMKVQHDTSMVVRKPSRDTSTTRPCSASLGEKAIECTTKPRLPQSHLARRETGRASENSHRASARLRTNADPVIRLARFEFPRICKASPDTTLTWLLPPGRDLAHCRFAIVAEVGEGGLDAGYLCHARARVSTMLL